MLAMGFYTITAYQTNLAWWAFLLAVFISFGFSLPIGIIQAITNNQIGLNVLTEFIYGYIQPGRPLALMMYVSPISPQAVPFLFPHSVQANPYQLQNFWLHHHVSSPQLHLGPQIWPLHEDTA